MKMKYKIYSLSTLDLNIGYSNLIIVHFQAYGNQQYHN